MFSEQRIADIQRRIRRWIHPAPADSPQGSLEELNADVASLEAQLQSLFPNAQPGSPFESLKEQAVFGAVLESMVEGVIVADLAGKLLVFNAAARALLDQGESDVGPQGWSEQYGLFRTDGTLYPSHDLPLTRAMQGHTVSGEEIIVRARGSEDTYVTSSARPLMSHGGEQVGAVVVFHDITEFRNVERELREARNRAEQGSRAKSEFLANMSHEIRTPLTAVLGFADLLLDPALNASNRLNYIQAVRRNGEHLLGLISDVLDLSKLQADKMSVERIEFSLHQLLHEVASVMQVRAREKGLDFTVVYETPIPVHIRSDAMRIRQILLNLLGNAVKFTAQGEVRLACRCLDPGTESCRLVFAVSDTGIGLNQEEIEQLFQAFHQANLSTTREYGGTGLGLAICRALADALGGEIRVDSTPRQGSTFSLILNEAVDDETPMVDEHARAQAELNVDPRESSPSELLSGRVLLAEDGRDNQILISTILSSQGLTVDIADDGEVAVEKALNALELGTPYDLILMDMQMPRLDGYGATAKLRLKEYSGPIVALTAHAMSGERERCVAAGCDDYLTKPIARTVLVAAVASYLTRDRGDVPQPAVVPNIVATAPQVERGSLRSSYADDPDMAELVRGFVERLPGVVQDLCSAARSNDSERLSQLAHQLKGSAGGYGFHPVSQAAAELEAAARDADQKTEKALENLVQTCARVVFRSEDTPPDTEEQSVLIVDDSPDIHRLVGARLNAEDLKLLHAYDAEQALSIARDQRPDLILLDLEMPGTDGLALCRLLKGDDELALIPVIVLTGTSEVETKVQAFNLGAVDYVTKPFDAVELKARVRAALRTKHYHDLLTFKARIDALTGLWNRRYLNEQLSAEMSLLRRSALPVSVLMMDIDHFKPLNDTHGHAFGDVVIRRIAQMVRRLTRDSDVACRYGGEEFAIILRNTTTEGAVVVAERMRQKIAALEFTTGRKSVSATVSIGVSGSDTLGELGTLSGEQLLGAADKALYVAKRNGRNRVAR